MSELSGHDCPRCNVELFIEINEEVEGVDLLICKECWGVGVTAKSMDLVMSEGSLLDTKRDEIIKSLQKLSNPEVSNEDEEDELEENRDIKYSIGDELAEFKNNTEQNNELNSLQSGFQDVEEDLIKAEDL